MQKIKNNENYAVTKDGRVWSCKRKHFLKPHDNGTGYLQVWLYKNGKPDIQYVHRLVAEAFIPNPDNKPQVNHKDENRQNNCVKNLEWCTAQENIDYSQAKAIYCIELNKTFKSIMEAERQLKISNKTIWNVVVGKQKSTHGYHFKLA